MRRFLAAVALAAWMLPTAGLAGEPTRPSEDELFGGDDATDESDADPKPAEDKAPEEKAPEEKAPEKKAPEKATGGREDGIFGEGSDGPAINPTISDEEDDPLAIGGRLYLRLSSILLSEGSFSEQQVAMPSLLDLYLDARPDPRVRAFFNGRLYYDPTVAEGSTDLFGQPREDARVLIDQLWIKTDIARILYVTVGQQRIKWGAARLWNPTDFLNRERLDPLAIFDERTGVTALKLHLPIEANGWNFYALALFDDVDAIENIGGAFRAELVVGPSEIGLSFFGGKGRTTSLGIDFSAGIWDFDVYAEAGFTKEDGRIIYTYDGSTDLIPELLNAGQRTIDGWRPRVTTGLTYSFKVGDDDVFTLGAEYFYNSTGYDDEAVYPVLLTRGLFGGENAFESFYLGKHYAALFFLVPSPGSWDDITFTLSNLANLSDMSFISRLDFSATLHTRLRFEAYVQGHYGTPGGELRFQLDLEEVKQLIGTLPAGVLPDELTSDSIPSRVPFPYLLVGVNLRVSI